MSKKIKVIKTIGSENESDIILKSEGVANLQTEHLAKIPNVPFVRVAILIIVEKAALLFGNSHRRKSGDTMKLLAYLKELALMYYYNGEYYEKRANELNDPSMILDLGYLFWNPKKRFVKPPIEVRNTNIPGELLVIVKKTERPRYYIIECSYAESKIVIRHDNIGKATGEILKGFERGALLMFRSQAVDLDGNKSEWTGYFVIRVA